MNYRTENKLSRKPVVRERSPQFEGPPAMKRLTIDVPSELHANVKAGCARQGIKMADAIRKLLEEKFGNAE